jgi:transcriptional regulator with XRE-family HTH domain
MKAPVLTPEFMKDVQGAGWNIIAADVESVWVGCPRGGCNLRLRIKAGSSIPTVCRAKAPLPEIVVNSYLDDARPAMRDRRAELGLTIRDVEDISGIAPDHLAKMEKDDPSRIPNILTFVDQVKSLGYDLVLRPSESGLPPVTIGRIIETRPIQERRKKMFRAFGRIRKGRATALLPKP